MMSACRSDIIIENTSWLQADWQLGRAASILQVRSTTVALTDGEDIG